MLDAQRHGVGKIFFERVGWHALQTVGIDAVHEFLKAEILRRVCVRPRTVFAVIWRANSHQIIAEMQSAHEQQENRVEES